jgi:MoaA/NifB/PqqE/SkfB family radical SAM enzyme
MLSDKVRLAKFFALLAIKEHLAPKLHVRPLVAELFLTENCNLKCISCACWRDRTTSELTKAEWKSVVDQLVDLDILKVNFTGGEPLLRRDAPEIIAYARDRGVSQIHLNTNAVLLDDRRRNAVLDAGVRSFNISVDGPNAEVHEHVRGVPGSFAKTVANLKKLLAERDAYGLKVRMNFTVMRSNVAHLADMARLAQDLGVRLYLNLATDHTFLFRHEQAGGEAQVADAAVDEALGQLEQVLRQDRAWLPRFAELAYIPGHFGELVQNSLPCAESQIKLMIHSTGGVGGCWGHDPGQNVRTTSLREIVDGVDYREEHARLYRKDCVGCGSNYALNLRWRPRTYWADLMWRIGRKKLGKPVDAI